MRACVLSCYSHVRLSVTLRPVARQVPLSVESSRQGISSYDSVCVCVCVCVAGVCVWLVCMCSWCVCVAGVCVCVCVCCQGGGRGVGFAVKYIPAQPVEI